LVLRPAHARRRGTGASLRSISCSSVRGRSEWRRLRASSQRPCGCRGSVLRRLTVPDSPRCGSAPSESCWLPPSRRPRFGRCGGSSRRASRRTRGCERDAQLVEALEHPLICPLGVAALCLGRPNQFLVRVSRTTAHVLAEQLKGVPGVSKEPLDTRDLPLHVAPSGGAACDGRAVPRSCR